MIGLCGDGISKLFFICVLYFGFDRFENLYFIFSFLILVWIFR